MQNYEGVRSSRGNILPTFAERIRASVNQESDLSNIVFSGGLTREAVDSITQGFSDEGAGNLRERLEPHINQPPSYTPEGSGAVTGTYTVEEAEQWIAEYRDEVERLNLGTD